MNRWKLALEKFRNSKTYLLILGASATLWFFIRVIPKPSRATYPCMRAAAPIMSTFVIYLLGISVSIFSFRRFRLLFSRSSYLSGSLFLLLSILAFGFIFLQDQKESIARALNPLDNTFPVNSNEPVGVAKGLFPGRVVWIHDRDATNENYVPRSGSTNRWYSNSNTNQEVIHSMLRMSITSYAEKEDLAEAWDAIFKSFNHTAGKGDVGYTPGEKIAFKINLTNQSARDSERALRMDATPQLLNAILSQLVNVVGVAQEDITMGDPYREFRSEYKSLVKSKFPDVYYVDGKGGSGINQTKPSDEDILVFSDGQYSSTLPQQYLDAEYVINIPCLKTHNEGGITLIAKNHQGSFLEKGDDPRGQYAINMHYSLPWNSKGSSQYRHTVDYMGHEQTGGKALIYIIDGIWAGESWQGWIKKFNSAPFNNDYPNSIFVGQDPVALESVGYDILFNENVVDANKEGYPIAMKVEIADHLAQCASSEFWPDWIEYDPEFDGTPLESLGVFEHWNNPTDRLYSRNLDPETGTGIELKYMETQTLDIREGQVQTISIAAPNPFKHSTTFSKPAQVSDDASLVIYNLKGQVIQRFDFSASPQLSWDGYDSKGKQVPTGMYIYKIQDPANLSLLSGKVILKRD